MSKKEIKLTNWQVPQRPSMADLFKSAKPLDIKKYDNIGQVEEHKDVESVIEKMIAKQEKARGVKIDEKAQKQQLSMGGINDNRKDKKPLR